MAGLLNNPYLLGAIILGLVNLVLLLVLFRLFWRYQKIQKELLAGEDKANLQEMVLRHKKLHATYSKNLKELGIILGEIVERNKLNVQKTGLVRYNPFRDAGGNMSFALALLDGEDNGIVISSLHSREGTRIYAKSIQKGKSEYNLTDEEKEAIKSANDKLKSQ